MIWTDEEIESILEDEDFDISAIYVLGDGKFDLNSPETSEKIAHAFKTAMKEARRKHMESRSSDGDLVGRKDSSYSTLRDRK